MKHSLTLVGLVGTLALTAGCASMASHQSEAEMIAAAKELDARFLSAFNEGDVDAMMATYWNSPDLASYPPDALACYGWAAVKQHLEQSPAIPGAELRLVDIHYRVAGDCVIGWGEWRMKIPGQSQEVAGRYTDVKAQRDGQWVFLLDHISSPMTGE